MKTKKPLSTIAYDEEVLKDRLAYLLGHGLIGFWSYIRHNGESTSGESERKDHFHVRIEPNDALDPVELKTLFNASDGSPTCLNWRPSVFSDWYYYVLHDPDYLEAKGLSRMFVYDPEDMQTSDSLELDRLVSENPCPLSTRLRSAILGKMPLREMYLRGLITPQNANGVRLISEAVNPELKKVKED